MVKSCELKIIDDKCYYKLSGCSDDELHDIINYKSWILRGFRGGKERKYFTYVYSNTYNEKIVYSSIGFASLLIRYLNSLGYLIKGKELFRSRKILIGKIYYGLWDFQKDAIKAWFNNNGSGVIKCPTGSGKSILACDIISKLGLRTIICVHTNDLLINVWYNNLIEQFGEVIKSRLGIIGGGLNKKERMEMRLIKDTDIDTNINKDIVIASTQTLMNNIDKLKDQKFGLCIFDEVHHSPAEQFKTVLSNINAPYRLGLSATLVRPDGLSPMIYGLIGDIVYSVSIKELIRRNKLVEPVFTSIVINDDSIQSDISDCGFTGFKLSRYVKERSASSVIKKDYILNLVNGLVVNNKKFIMYTDYVNEKGSIHTRDYFVNKLIKMGIRTVGVSAKMQSSERDYIFDLLKKSEIDSLVFGRLGSEGVNIPNIDSIVMCNATASTITYPQRVGRAMRKVFSNDNKKYAYIYELLLDTPLETKWSGVNFYEYRAEGFEKKVININN